MDRTPLIGTIGATVTWFAPETLAQITGTLTAVYLTLKIVGWFLDRRRERNERRNSDNQ